MSKYCPSYGEELIDDAKFCKSCGENLKNSNTGQTTENATQQVPPVVENEHKAAIVIGYIFSILIPLIGLIAGIYLITRKDSQKAKKHGKYVLIISVIVWILSFIIMRG